MSVSIDLGYASEPTGPQPVLESDGAVRVSVDGQLLTTFDDPNVDAMTVWDTLYDSSGRQRDRAGFVGAWFELELGGLSDAVLRIDEGEVARFEALSVRVTDDIASRYTFELSFVDAEHARLAYLVHRLDSGGYEPRPPERSAVGYAVALDELCRELVGCYEDWRGYLTTARDEVDEAFFDERVAELEAAVGGTWWT